MGMMNGLPETIMLWSIVVAAFVAVMAMAIALVVVAGSLTVFLVNVLT